MVCNHLEGHSYAEVVEAIRAVGNRDRPNALVVNPNGLSQEAEGFGDVARRDRLQPLFRADLHAPFENVFVRSPGGHTCNQLARVQKLLVMFLLEFEAGKSRGHFTCQCL